ncbi:MAG: ATP-binding protein [Nitritalea sp.]
MGAHVFTLHKGLDQLGELRGFIRSQLARTPMKEEKQMMVVLAIEEVCANLIIHEFKQRDGESIVVSIRNTDKKIIFEIKNRGGSFNMLEYQEPNLREVKASKRKGGMGIALIKRIIDHIEYDISPEYNTCRLIKVLD